MGREKCPQQMSNKKGDNIQVLRRVIGSEIDDGLKAELFKEWKVECVREAGSRGGGSERIENVEQGLASEIRREMEGKQQHTLYKKNTPHTDCTHNTYKYIYVKRETGDGKGEKDADKKPTGTSPLTPCQS